MFFFNNNNSSCSCNRGQCRSKCVQCRPVNNCCKSKPECCCAQHNNDNNCCCHREEHRPEARPCCKCWCCMKEMHGGNEDKCDY